MVAKFKCTEKEAPEEFYFLAKIHHLDKYQFLYSLMHQIWELLPFNEKELEDEKMFKYDDLICCVDKTNGSYCEVLGSGWLPIPSRIRIHQKKLRQMQKNIIQLKLF